MPRRYTPRRANAKWREGAPASVLDCFDHPGYADRFTIYTTEQTPEAALMYFGSGTDPRAISYWGECPAHLVAAFRYENARRRVRWLDLPEAVRAAFLATA